MNCVRSGDLMIITVKNVKKYVLEVDESEMYLLTNLVRIGGSDKDIIKLSYPKLQNNPSQLENKRKLSSKLHSNMRIYI
jgi:hypothetical protein